MNVLVDLAILVILVVSFRFCVAVYYSIKESRGRQWDTSPENPEWNPDHPRWKRTY